MELEVVGRCMASPLGGACSSYLVRGGGSTILLDCGPGALERLWASGALAELDAIVISHMHQDHALDLIPMSNAITAQVLADRRGPDRPLALHVPRDRGPERLAAFAAAVGDDPDRFATSFALHEYDASDEVRIGALTLTFAPTVHPEPCFAPRVTDGASTLVYSADGAVSDSLERHAAGAGLLLAEASLVDDADLAARYGHMTGEQAADLAGRAGARHLVLTHLSPWVPGQDEENLRRARARFDGPVELATPGATVVVPTA